VSGRTLIVVANRLPVRWRDGTWQASGGGLVTALRPVIEESGGHWVGWDGGNPDVPATVDGLAAVMHPVSLSEQEIAGHYDGFANRTIWPLFHDLVVQPVLDRAWWLLHKDVNWRFAKAVASVDTKDPIVWVHDYHLMLAPAMIRSLRPGCPIGFFLHIPFPPPELLARLPWRRDLLEGLLGADVVSFHTTRYRDNFVRSVLRVMTDTQLIGETLVLADGRRVRTAAHPISIDADEFAALATSQETDSELKALREQFEGRRVLLGVDRLDYTKGIRHRLQAIAHLLENYPDLRRQFAFVQIAVPSRDDVQEYRDLRDEVEGTVGRINGRFTEPGHDVPVHYLYRSISPARLAAYYRLADVCCVTPLKDGMNLVAKEFVTVQGAGGEAGALLLSEFTGAVLEMTDAISCNPFDVEGMGELMEQCLELDLSDRRQRIERMAARVHEHDVHAWVASELDLLAEHR
jgi:trehalose 6-phosphate synthase